MSIATAIQRLSDAKTAIATAITTKGGTVSAGDGFEDFASDIASIPAGSGTDTLNIEVYSSQALIPSKFRAFRFSNDIKKFNYNCTYSSSGNDWTYLMESLQHIDGTALDEITITAPNKPTNFQNAFQGIQTKKLVFNVDTSMVTNWVSTFNGTSIEELLGTPLDFSSATSANKTFTNRNLREIRFAPNTARLSKLAYIYYGSTLSNASLVSMANGLNETVTGQTMTLGRGDRPKLPNIMGTVAMDSGNTYHLFTESASGTTSLENFITQTKGWSVAQGE